MESTFKGFGNECGIVGGTPSFSEEVGAPLPVSSANAVRALRSPVLLHLTLEMDTKIVSNQGHAQGHRMA